MESTESKRKRGRESERDHKMSFLAQLNDSIKISINIQTFYWKLKQKISTKFYRFKNAKKNSSETKKIVYKYLIHIAMKVEKSEQELKRE